MLLPGTLLITGDFNIHWDDQGNGDVKRLSSILDSMDLKQQVTSPTHRHGHILDLVITRGQESLVEGVSVQQAQISDHSPVVCSMRMESKQLACRVYTFRKFRTVNREEFARDINLAVPVADTSTDGFN